VDNELKASQYLKQIEGFSKPASASPYESQMYLDGHEPKDEPKSKSLQQIEGLRPDMTADEVPQWTLDQGLDILDLAFAKFPRASKLIGMISGGHDSLAACHVASRHPNFYGVCHINTGIGIEETRQFARDVSKAQGWKFLEYKAMDYLRGNGDPDPQNYREMVLENGFPGPPMHFKMYRRLKERPIRMMLRDVKEHRLEPIIMASGKRVHESARRMRQTNKIDKVGSQVWVSPIWNMTSEDKDKYLIDNGLPRNPISDKLCMSGECLCGAFAHPGELAEIRLASPETYDLIKALEADVRAAGHDWGWEQRPPKLKTKKVRVGMPLCSDCENRASQMTLEGLELIN